jgi:hypothetical protein
MWGEVRKSWVGSSWVARLGRAKDKYRGLRCGSLETRSALAVLADDEHVSVVRHGLMHDVTDHPGDVSHYEPNEIR